MSKVPEYDSPGLVGYWVSDGLPSLEASLVLRRQGWLLSARSGSGITPAIGAGLHSRAPTFGLVAGTAERELAAPAYVHAERAVEALAKLTALMGSAAAPARRTL